jgi:hypothetical protein
MNRIQVLISSLAVALVLVVSAGHAADLKYTKSATTDLNGDGKPEHVSLTISKNESRPGTLHVGKLSAVIDEELPEGLAIVDIDSKDRFKEVVVRCGNPYDGGYFNHVYEYDGKTLKEIGALGSAQFTGHGIVYADSWTGSFVIKRKFVLNGKTRKIEEVRQPMYYIGRTSKADSSFPIYMSPTDPSVVANVEPKSQVLIVAVAFQPVKKTLKSDEDETLGQDWYLVKTRSGLMGWARHEDAVRYLAIPQAG